MNSHVSIENIQRLAKKRGLTFAFEPKYNGYTLRQTNTGELLMEYAPITISLVKRFNVWVHEFNMLKVCNH